VLGIVRGDLEVAATYCAVWPGRLRRIVGILAVAAGIMLVSSAPEVKAQDVHYVPVINFVNANVRGWISDPVIVQTLKAQNAANAHLGMPEIAAMDAEWRDEINRTNRQMIDRVLATPLSGFLKEKEDEAQGAITELFVMDARGLNAGQSGITSDYWQGDEEKFIKSFAAGPAAVFVDAARKDESTQMLQSQVSMTIVDEQNKPIGAITVGINLDQL
jgi:hypothetical protein